MLGLGLGLALLLPLLALPAQAQEYRPRRTPPQLEADAATTLLLDFTRSGSPVVQSRGSRTLQREADARLEDGVLRGRVTLEAARLLNPASFTLELVLAAPASFAGNEQYFSWNCEKAYRAFVGAGEFRFHSLGRVLPSGGFLLQQPLANNGRYFCNQPGNNFVYVAVGIDLAQRRVAGVVRDLDGDLLSQRYEFAAPMRLNGDELTKLPASDAEQLEAKLWREMAQLVARSTQADQPQTLSIGHPEVRIKQLRLSQGYRTEVLDLNPRPTQAGAGQWFDAQQLDAARAQTATRERSVGYGGRNNFRLLPLTESYLALAPGDPAVELKLNNLPVGIYSAYLIGQIDPKGRAQLERIWQPCPMLFTAHDAQGNQLEAGRRLLKQSFTLRRMQGFHFHVNQPGDVTLRFAVTKEAQETAWLMGIAVTDNLDGLPSMAIKSRQNYGAPSATPQRLTEITAERRQRDEVIWNALPPVNSHFQIHNQTQAFLTAGATLQVPAMNFVALEPDVRSYNWHQHAFSPLDLVLPKTGQTIRAQDVFSAAPTPAGVDDGTGLFFRKADHPELPHDVYVTPRALLMGRRYLDYLGAVIDSRGSIRGLMLAKQYFEKGDANVGHDAALALVRLAYDWPAIEMNLHEIRLSTHSPDLEYNTDWSSSRNGKYFYEGWSGNNFLGLMEAYDQLFPYIQDNALFASAVGRFIPWIKTPQDVVAFLDRWLVFAGVRDYEQQRIRAAPVMESAARCLGPSPQTARWFDLTQVPTEIYPTEGRFNELYATSITRDGVHYIGSYLVYAFGFAQDLVDRAALMADAKRQGVQLRMDLSDAQQYPKVRKAADFLLDMFVAGGFPIMVGDASGGPHTGHEAPKRMKMAQASLRHAALLWDLPRQAWVLKHQLGVSEPAIDALAAQQPHDPVLHNTSRVLAGAGSAVVELFPEAKDVHAKMAATLRLGIGQGHSHNDYLDLNLFDMGLPLAVDLACRDEGNYWSRPGAGWAFLHNHAIASADDDPRQAGVQQGEPWLEAFAPPALRAVYRGKDSELRRDVVVMPLRDQALPHVPNAYVFDVQRLRGGKLHTWCFHGCESEEVQVNTSMTAATDSRWLDRLLPGTQRQGIAPEQLTATWTMTRAAREIPHQFKGGGVIKAVACEPTVLGKAYDANRPEVKMNVTLLDAAGQQVMVGSPYSQQYSYCFPFLWVQKPAGDGDSVYPAIYHWQRGQEPTVKEARLISRDPLTVEVRTALGQTDRFISTAQGLVVTRHDAQGLAWVKVVGQQQLQGEGVKLQLATDAYAARITGMDYVQRTLTTDTALPRDPGVTAGNAARKSYLQLTGSGQSFTFADDLLISQGALTAISPNPRQPALWQIDMARPPLFSERVNRSVDGYTLTSEDHQWQFRAGQLLQGAAGKTPDASGFTDVNGDGRASVLCYELGVSDELRLPAELEIRRTAKGYEARGNVAAQGTLNGQTVRVEPSTTWQPLR